MLEKFVYINGQNEHFNFGEEGVFVNESSLRDYEWNVVSENNKISNLNKKITNRSLPIVILCDTEEEGIKKKNSLFEVLEKDALKVTPGRIILGSYYMKCVCTGSKKSQYLQSKRLLSLTLTLTTDSPNWVKETTSHFAPAAQQQGRNLDFKRDFKYDYTSEFKNKTLNNTDFVESNFIMCIYGPATNPTVYIGGHEYTVNTELSNNEYLTINSIEKTIVLTKYDGTLVNCFGDRNKDSYVFEKIPSGNNIVTWNGTFDFDVTLCEERSEPKWE